MTDQSVHPLHLVRRSYVTDSTVRDGWSSRDHLDEKGLNREWFLKELFASNGHPLRIEAGIRVAGDEKSADLSLEREHLTQQLMTIDAVVLMTQWY